jgi:hypothetical protein
MVSRERREGGGEEEEGGGEGGRERERERENTREQNVPLEKGSLAPGLESSGLGAGCAR